MKEGQGRQTDTSESLCRLSSMSFFHYCNCSQYWCFRNMNGIHWSIIINKRPSWNLVSLPLSANHAYFLTLFVRTIFCNALLQKKCFSVCVGLEHHHWHHRNRGKACEAECRPNCHSHTWQAELSHPGKESAQKDIPWGTPKNSWRAGKGREITTFTKCLLVHKPNTCSEIPVLLSSRLSCEHP